MLLVVLALDDDVDLFAVLEDVLGVLHVAAELRDVEQALDARRDLNERAELRRAHDGALDRDADLQRLGRLVPGIGEALLHRQGDLAVAVLARAHAHAEHFDLHDVTGLGDVGGTVGAVPGDFALVHEAVDAVAEIHEQAEVTDLRDGALEALAGLEGLHPLARLLALVALQDAAAADDDALATARRRDGELELLADELGRICERRE